jgi:hypothetical protein
VVIQHLVYGKKFDRCPLLSVLLHNRQRGEGQRRKREPSAVSPDFLILRTGECELIVFERSDQIREGRNAFDSKERYASTRPTRLDPIFWACMRRFAFSEAKM